ncbi:MAG: SRPBCC family protein [Saprospiraceae bacterium]
MKTITTSIIINAPITQVWKIFADFENYENWNPFVKSIKGKVKKGNQIEVTLTLEGMSDQVFTPQVLDFIPKKSFRWKGKLGINGIFDGEHYFNFEAIDNGKTKLTHGENFSGIMSGLIFKMIGKKTENGFHAMNQALKNECEK